jgi:anti-anti-sigma factor
MKNELFTVREDDPVHIIELRLPGVLDNEDLDRLSDSLIQLLEANPSDLWIVDMTGVTYAGSAILGMLVNMRQIVKRAKGKLVLHGMSERLIGIFRTCCLIELFTIARTYSEARRAAGV